MNFHRTAALLASWGMAVVGEKKRITYGFTNLMNGPGLVRDRDR
jgi:hypothetical protein